LLDQLRDRGWGLGLGGLGYCCCSSYSWGGHCSSSS
jgi:hypothetical protein